MPAIKPGRISGQKALENEILRVLRKHEPGLHFSAIQRSLQIRSPNRISAALKSLHKKRVIAAKRQLGPGIARRIYSITDANRASLQLVMDDADRLVDEIMSDPVAVAQKLKALREEIEEIQLAVRMLQDASGLKVVRAKDERG